MIKVKLEMDFTDALNKNYRISLNNPRADLTDSQVFDAMDEIVTANAFKSNNGDLVAREAARIITTSVEELEA